MDLALALTKARGLLHEHGLHGWQVGLDNAKRRAGKCDYTAKMITLSRHLTRLHTEAEVTDTILHEIAHALVGPAHGHDAAWRSKALDIGCTGTRCLPPDAAQVPGAWEGTCPKGHARTAHKRPERVTSCSLCARGFDPDSILSWTWRGASVRLHPKYTSELVRLSRRYGDAGLIAEQLELDTVLGGGPENPRVQSFLAPALRAGAAVRITAPGRYEGTSGVVTGLGRMRYRVKTDAGILQVPPRWLEPLV